MDQERESRDAAGIGPYAREREHLVPMSSLDSWDVSDGEPDIRGWEVRTVSGRQLGSVRDLLVDEAAREVVLLDVDLPASDRHTFVPIRVVQIDRAKRVVLMDSADLPTADIARAAPASVTADRRERESATVRYPQSDREVRMGRSSLGDNAMLADGPAGSAADRRMGERRKIERTSTDL